ncbi:MAG: hypothetical protein AAFQ74_17955 [Cyanobacteria bacterium J06623_4]
MFKPALLTAIPVLLFLLGCSGGSRIISPSESSTSTTEVSDAGDLIASDDSAADSAEDASEADAENGDGESEEDEDTAGIDQKNVKLVVNNQTTAGQIVVEQVATARDGWISIHKSQEDGGIQLPESIGEARVDSGNSEDVIVDLWEAPDIDEKLWVLLHIDAGERGTYEFPGKDQPVRKNGETMARSFVIQDPNPEAVNDEEAAE